MTDLPIHEFIDMTKMSCPDLRHRMVLHNSDLGLEMATRAFPDRPDIQDIILQHVEEDLSCTPTLSDWLAHCDMELWPEPLYRRQGASPDELADRVGTAQGLKDEGHLRPVIDLLFSPTKYAGQKALPVLFNGFGPTLVGRIIGGPRYVTGRHCEKTIFDPAYAAEAVIYYLYGTIPPLSDIVRAVRHHPSGQKEKPPCQQSGT